MHTFLHRKEDSKRPSAGSPAKAITSFIVGVMNPSKNWSISDVLMGASCWDNRIGVQIPGFVCFSFSQESM